MEEWKIFKKSRMCVWEISTLGNVRKNGKHYTPYEKGGIEGSRYLCISTNDPYNGYIHRIAANTFLENPEGKLTVNHKDGNKHNNAITNLEFKGYQEQKCHAIDIGVDNNSAKHWDGVTPYYEYLNNRRAQVSQLLDRGMTPPQIAKEIGTYTAQVWTDIKYLEKQ
jgi:hypothetical protein